MADEGAVAGAGIVAKIGGASLGGALWGIFASGFLIIPMVLASLLSPIFRKAHNAVESKVNSTDVSAKRKAQPQKVSKNDKSYQSKMATLENERRISQLQEEMQRLRSKSQKSKKAASKDPDFQSV